MKNAIGRAIPMAMEYLAGKKLYVGEFAMKPAGNRQGKNKTGH